jgi:hypothetical protein
MSIHRGPFIDSDLLPPVPGLDPPTLEPRTYVLVDNDAKVCRVISEVELEASYVDNNIESFQLQDINLLTLDVDNHDVNITYSSGAKTSLMLGSIDFEDGRMAEQYGQSNGVIYPISDSGELLFDAINTPRLVAMRTWYHNEAKRVNDERLEIAETVHAFAHVIAELGEQAERGHLWH